MKKSIPSHLRDLHRLGKADRHLSAAQGELGALINMESREKSPALYAAANKAWDELERMRRHLSSMPIRDAALKASR
jgi:ribosome-associated translation inhibitor RaiA